VRILFGVCGEGMGHAMRSQVVGEHLVSRGHRVQFACSAGRAYDYLRSKGNRVVRVPGFNMVVQNNRVQPTQTLAFNALKHLATPVLWHAWCAMNVEPPDVVISDFDAWSARYAAFFRKPLLAVDNIHFINRCTHPPEFVQAHREAAAIAFPVAQQTVPGALEYLVTTFAPAPICKPATTLHLPIIRREVLQATPSQGRHLLVYFNDRADWNRIVAALSAYHGPIIAYGSRSTGRHGNVEMRAFSEKALVDDLASCFAVIAGAGFTLMTEAITLGKPMLAVPFDGSFEQILNALYLEREGYGWYASELSPVALQAFVPNIPRFEVSLRRFRHDGNRGILNRIDKLLGT
jgi:uncharacterized protein (TIGR00661 family)